MALFPDLRLENRRDPPDLKKYLIIGAPHTSNWDFIYMIFLVFQFRLNVCWLGKDSIFRFPFRSFMRWLGGIPVDRQRQGNVVDETVKSFGDYDEMILVLAPEGTRRRVDKWKTGFYYIALGSGLPILLGYIDNRNKVLCLGKLFFPTGDFARDMGEIRGYYSDFLAVKD